MLDLEMMRKSMSEDLRVPAGLYKEQEKFLINLANKNKKVYSQIKCLTEENMKGSIQELMYSKKIWDDEILVSGGISYYHIENIDNRCTSDGKPFKTKYRVAMTSKQCDKLLKFRIKTASGEIFSVGAKTVAEAQLVVDEIFGAGMYRVSQMLY